jgi:tetratricopeptide (TPR) repeat protein
MQFMEAGRRLYDQKDYSRAILQFKNAADIANGDPEPSYWLGLSYLGAGNIQQAIPYFRQAAKLNPKHAAAQLRLGEILALTDNKELLQEALNRLQIVLTTSPSAKALSALALTEMKLGNADEGERHLQECLDRFPQELSSYMILAKSKILKRDFNGAELLLKKAVQAAPRSGEALVALGNFYVLTGKDAEAEKWFRQAIDLNQKDGTALFDLAMLQYRTGRKSEAEQILKQLSTFPDPALQPLHAIYLLKEGDQAGAVAELERLVHANPKSQDLRTRLIAAYWTTHRLADVEKVLNAAIKDNPKDFQALLQRGELYVATARYPQAQSDLDQAHGFRRDSPAVHYVLAKLNQARGADLSYRQELGEAIRLGPDLLQARLELAQALISNNAADSALKVLDEAPVSEKNSLQLLIQRNWALLGLNDFPELRKGVSKGLTAGRAPELLIQQGAIQLADRDFPAAQASIEEALHKTPNDSRALAALAELYKAQKRTGELTNRLKRYAEQNKSPEIQMFVGNWLHTNGDRDGAMAFFQAAKAADPNFHEADIAIAVIDMESGRPEGARSILNNLIAIRDRDVSLRVRSAVNESTSGNTTQAITQYRQILTIDQNNVFALNNLAYLLANSNQPDEALAFAQRAKELRPSVPQVEDTLGWVLVQKRIYNEAVRHLQSAANEQPNDPVIRYHLGIAYWRSGDRTRGAQMLSAALKAAPNLPEAAMARQQMSEAGK